MMEDELIKIWQSSTKVEQVKFEKSRLMLDMQTSLDRFHRLVKYGIFIEQFAAFTIVPVFLFYIYFVPPVLSKIASFLIALWAIWYMIRLRNVKKGKPKSVTLNYLDYLKKNQSYLKLLKNMGDTVIYWYVLPPLTGYFLFIIGFSVDGIIEYRFLTKLILVGIATGIATYFYSRWIVKKIYSPRLKKIDELIKVLEE